MRFVVLDFEATCDEPYNPAPQEIIEFPAVVVDPGAPADAVEFHTYVRPVVHPHLTGFCADLTGIPQELVNAAPTFPEALKLFDAWWQTTICTDALAVTCGDWDLGSLLPRQCEQHCLAVPRWATRWANLKRLFEDHFPHASDRAGLAEIASSLGLSLVGRLHSGIDDARNIARLLRKMLDLGVSVKNTAFWHCLGCGKDNSLLKRTCSACGKARVALKPGDWRCPRCSCTNFAIRDRCFDCGIPRPGGGTSSVMKRGDWLCRQCGEHNFARRENCFRCGERR